MLKLDGFFKYEWSFHGNQRAGSGSARELQLQSDKTVEAMHQVDPASEEYAELVLELGRLHHLFEEADGFSAESRTARVLQGLGVPQEWWQRPLSQLSGGWQMRIHLAKLILSQPSLLGGKLAGLLCFCFLASALFCASAAISLFLTLSLKLFR